MPGSQVFISHASADDNFVNQLRQKLDGQGISTWVDSRELVAGNELQEEIQNAIEQARQVLVVLSPSTINSAWVKKEVEFALAVKKRHSNSDYRVIPLMLPGIEPPALSLWFGEEPVGIRVEPGMGELDEAMPGILAALGERLPDDRQPKQKIAAKPVEELLLELSKPGIQVLDDGRRQVNAEAELIYQPSDPNQREIKSKPFRFTAPLGLFEIDDLGWYLQDYSAWPVGVFRERAESIEQLFPTWGCQLYQAALAHESAQIPVNAWRQNKTRTERRFSIRVDADLLDDADDQQKIDANTASTRLLRLPWELLHDNKRYLLEGRYPVGVRRRLPNREDLTPTQSKLPIRILLISPRPEQEGVAYIDHRISALPLVEALESLGDLMELTVLDPPTLPALENAIKNAEESGKSFEVLHFDGHGIYDPQHGLGALCFEDPQDADPKQGKLEQRKNELVYADSLAKLLHDYRIPLVFLEACQSAQSQADPNASVAASLLEAGVSSVVAMSHSVLVETARRFVTVFYLQLAQGQRVGKAVLEGQKALKLETGRIDIPGAGRLDLQDWFVPVLFQERRDPQLFEEIPSEQMQSGKDKERENRLGDLPETPTHHFIGRSRELLKLERQLFSNGGRYAVIKGQGGAGKTAIAVELARWLVRSRRFDHCAFVSLENTLDERAVLDAFGRQLVSNYSVAEHPDLAKALQPVERELQNQACVLVLDNLETLLADLNNCNSVMALAQRLLQASEKTRLIFTSREPLPAPFDTGRNAIELGALSRDDAVRLTYQVMRQAGITLKKDDSGNEPQQITDLVEAVNCHARALVLIAPKLGDGVTVTTDNLHKIMVELERQHPGERELSLFASVELSLQRLPTETREKIQDLSVFHDGANIVSMSNVLQLEVEQAASIAKQLIDVGLAEVFPLSIPYLRLDPALTAYLTHVGARSGGDPAGEQENQQAGLSPAEQAPTQRWMAEMQHLVDFLYQQNFQDSHLASQLTLLELPNLLAFLQQLAQQPPELIGPERVIDTAGSIEQLLANLNRPLALQRVIDIRQQAAAALGHWSHAVFHSKGLNINRLLQQSDLHAALQAAQSLLQRCQAEGEKAYSGADYDLAMAHKLLGQVLNAAGNSEAALQLSIQAQQRFERLGKSGERMASVSLAQKGDCLTKLGRLDKAAKVHQEAIRRAEKLQDKRGVAVKKGQLATVRLMQRDYEKALQGLQEARDLFQQLNEPAMVATAWHQIGMVYREAGQLTQAESAYKHSLAIKTQQKNRAGEASSLNELGSLYGAWQRPEEAVKFYRQASDIYTQLGNLINEGAARNNLANTLIELRQYGSARQELLRAIDCNKPYGHSAEPWKTWGILGKLEKTSGHPEAAANARQKALSSYLSYRRDGGENLTGTRNLNEAVLEAVLNRKEDEIRPALEQLQQEAEAPNQQALFTHLLAVLAGDRNPVMAEDEALDFDDAAELTLLLEKLP